MSKPDKSSPLDALELESRVAALEAKLAELIADTETCEGVRSRRNFRETAHLRQGSVAAQTAAEAKRADIRARAAACPRVAITNPAERTGGLHSLTGTPLNSVRCGYLINKATSPSVASFDIAPGATTIMDAEELDTVLRRDARTAGHFEAGRLLQRPLTAEENERHQFEIEGVAL